MRALVELTGAALLFLMPFLGFAGAPWTAVLAAAGIGFIGYWKLRPDVYRRARNRGAAYVAMSVAWVFAAQVITWGAIFSVGRGFGLLLRG